MNRVKNYWFIGLCFIAVEIFSPTPASGILLKNDIQKLNNALIFDFFMNYEISERNGNLATIIDYFPNFDANLFKNIKVESNMGGRNEVCNFGFNDNGTLHSLSYEIKNKIYTYEFNYESNRLESVSIAGDKKILFTYKKGKLQTITRVSTGRSLEFSFNYANGENKVQIKTFINQDGKRLPNREESFVSWNDQFKLTAFRIDVYSSRNIKYSVEGNLASYTFSNVDNDNNQINWEYTLDNKGNWIERKDKKSFFKRTIEYK